MTAFTAPPLSRLSWPGKSQMTSDAINTAGGRKSHGDRATHVIPATSHGLDHPCLAIHRKEGMKKANSPPAFTLTAPSRPVHATIPADHKPTCMIRGFHWIPFRRGGTNQTSTDGNRKAAPMFKRRYAHA